MEAGWLDERRATLPQLSYPFARLVDLDRWQQPIARCQHQAEVEDRVPH